MSRWSSTAAERAELRWRGGQRHGKGSKGRGLTDGETDDGRAPGLLHAHALERVVDTREEELKREDNQAAETTKPGRRVSVQALSWGLAGWWRRAVPHPRAPVEPAGVRCWRRSRSVPSCRDSCGHSGPCGVEQDLGVCKKCAGASVQQHSRGRRTAGQERRSRRAQRGGLEAQRRVERHEAQHCASELMGAFCAKAAQERKQRQRHVCIFFFFSFTSWYSHQRKSFAALRGFPAVLPTHPGGCVRSSSPCE